MKIFWSWQSDTPGKIGRHLIRETLEAVIADLNASDELNESQRELDHDRKNVSGSPDLANIILEKIAASDVVIADVTLVGRVDAKNSKQLINSNVAIELGFALSAITDRRLIMVMNEHCGTQEALPFDLRHKAGPIIFRLAPDASKEDIEVARKQIAAKLKIALKAMSPKQPVATAAIVAIPSIAGDPSRFQEAGTELAKRTDGGAGSKSLVMPGGPMLFLRVIPTKPVPELSRAHARALVRENLNHLQPLCRDWQSLSFEVNQHGALAFSADWQSGALCSGVQLFLNREIWAFDASTLSLGDDIRRGFPSVLVEDLFKAKLQEYIRFCDEKLGVEYPFDLKAGVVGVQNYKFYFQPHSWHEVPRIVENTVEWSGRISDAKGASTFLEQLFKRFFDSAAIVRPKNFNGVATD